MSARPGQGHPPFFANAQVLALDPADVLVPTRIGFLHEDKAVALGRLMAVDGQRTPINVVRGKNAKPGACGAGSLRKGGGSFSQSP